MLFDVVKHWEIVANTVERQSFVAVRFLARWENVVLRTGPPDANEVFHVETDVRRFLNRNLVHNAPTVHDHVVRLFTTNLQPL